MSESKFKAGDKVRVIKYGHLGWYDSVETFNRFKNFEIATAKNFEMVLMWGKQALDNRIPDGNEDFSHLIYSQSDKGGVFVDSSPKLVGREGIVRGSHIDLYGGEGQANEEHFRHSYALDGIPEKVAWYDEEQLELIT